MPAKWHKYSYSAQLQERRTLAATVIFVIVLIILFSFVHANLISMYALTGTAMEPSLLAGDTVVSTPLYDPERRTEDSLLPFAASKRGDLVVLAPAYTERLAFPARVARSFVSFVTFQRIRPFSRSDSPGEKPTVRRLLGFPGDTIYMKDFILYIKPADSTHFLTEFELVGHVYEVSIDPLPAEWGPDMPFSASFSQRVLAPDEYFVACDNRKLSSDSRIWGPIHHDRIKGKVILRYWPFDRFAIP